MPLFALTLLVLVAFSSGNQNCSNIRDLNSCTEVKISENQELAAVVEISNIDSVMLKAFSDPVIITCINGGALAFSNMTRVTIHNMAFVSCGNSDYGLRFTNVSNVELSNIVLSNNSFGALSVVGGNVSLTNISITDNTGGGQNVVSLINCPMVHISGRNEISNNWLESNLRCHDSEAKVHFDDLKTVMFVNNSEIIIIDGSLNVNDNMGFSGIIYIKNVQMFNFYGEGKFHGNKVCVNGALHFEKVNALLSGKFVFENNSGGEYYFQKRPTAAASISVRGSSLTVIGSIHFEHNRGDITAMYINQESAVYITGRLHITRQTDGFAGVFIRGESNLTINGAGEFLNNGVHNAVIRVETGIMDTTGNMTFLNNYGNSPCVFRIRSYVRMHGSILFRNNSGVFYIVDSTVKVDGEATFDSNNVRDFGIGGAIAMFRSELYLSGQYTFSNNSVSDVDGGVVYGHLSSLIFAGNGSFIGNSARYGGAIYLQNKPVIKLREGASLNFVSNTAIKGGALYIFGSRDSFKCNNKNADVDFDTPPCFITSNGTIDRYSVTFRNNTAEEGGGGSVLQVRVVEDFDITNSSISMLTSCNDCAVSLFKRETSKTNKDPLLSSDTLRLCFCNEGKPDCSKKHLSKSAIRGESFTVEVTSFTFNLFEVNPAHTIRSYFQSVNIDTDSRRLKGTSQTLQEHCTALNYTIQSTDVKEMIVISADESCEISNAQLTMEVTLNNCPYGFSRSEGMCVCDEHISRLVRECNVNSRELIKRNNSRNTWMTSYNESGETGIVYYEYCPLEYCLTSESAVAPLNPDSQCASNRTGTVCGKCRDGYSLLLGTPRCSKCTNSYLALLIPFAVVGILLVFFLFLTQLTVATGTIHGLILYANIVNIHRDIFFPKQFFPAFTVFISWLNLDFGINTCFYDGLDHLAYIGWQFVFPLYLWLIFGFMIVICRYSLRVSKLFGKSDPVAVLATIMLLSYNKLLQTIIAIFSVANLIYPPSHNSTFEDSTVWYYDGNVMYGKGAHIILCCVAVVVLLLLFLPYTSILVFAQVLQKSSHISACLLRSRLTPFIKSYQAPYKSKTRFWIGLCLLLRCAILSTISGTDNANNGLLATTIICFALICIIAVSGGIYSKRIIDILEVSFIMNLGILSIVTYHFQVTEIHPTGLTYLSVSIALVTFCGIIAARILIRVKKLSMFKKVSEKMKSKKLQKEESFLKIETPLEDEKSRQFVTTQDLVMMDDNTFQLREPLLEDTP
ncbi:uncharacterized protein LOC135343944 [Halichondria panicea]|uniref:uncharacterized protein LOC135343944 n=1 Tax=Halichondria panicea TaxID=6063 RepID=UPI00312B8638